MKNLFLITEIILKKKVYELKNKEQMKLQNLQQC